jgi:hypothetical protein
VIGTSSALLAAVMLLILILLWVRADSRARKYLSGLEESFSERDEIVELCPPEFVSQIFSAQDLTFISRLESTELKNQFLQERSAVALLWVKQTTTAIRRVMRRHLQASRLNVDIEFSTEARIFLQYAQLRLICGTLFLLIGLLGLQRLRGMAFYADELTQLIGSTLGEIAAGTRTGQMDRA